MKVAILIMMHKNPEQVLRLLKWYSSDETVCFLHIDKKMEIDIEDFFSRGKAVKKELVIVPNRKSVHLFSWSQIEAVMEMLHEAKRYEEKEQVAFDYFQLISGQDYPLRRYDEWIAMLKSDYPISYIDVNSTEEKRGIAHFQRIRYNHQRDKIANIVSKQKWLHFIYMLIHVVEQLHTYIVGTPEKQLAKKGYYGGMGSQWWTLSDRVIRECLDVYDGKKHVYMQKILEKVCTPDESYFQTVYLNMGYKKGDDKSHLVYCNFFSRGRNATGHPYILEAEDLEMLKYYVRIGCFFARKFDESQCSKVLDEIDKWIYEDRKDEYVPAD